LLRELLYNFKVAKIFAGNYTLELEIAKFKKLQNMQKSFKSIDLNSLIQSNKNKAVKMRMCKRAFRRFGKQEMQGC